MVESHLPADDSCCCVVKLVFTDRTSVCSPTLQEEHVLITAVSFALCEI